MTFNYKLIDEFLNAIFPLPEKFGIICDDDADESEPINFIHLQEIIYDIDHDANIYFGMSKIVITSSNLNNVVIKIPFNGYFIKSTAEEKYWHCFHWATGSDPKDYCLTEFEKYNKLKTYGLDCFVAKIMFYKEICGVRVFLQEQIIPENDSYYPHKPSKKSQDLANKWYDEGKFHIDPEWIANCLDKYGKSKVKRFLHYCANIDPDILEDIHDGNFGYRKDETPCLLDYSNFND